MKVCIAGGGNVGFYLAKSLLAHNHKITLIEANETQCAYLSNALDIPVVMGNSIYPHVLQAADCGNCAAFVAATGSDEYNLIACQMAKQLGVKKTVARASNPENRALLRELGVDIVVCGTDNLSHILEREIETDSIRQVLSMAGGTASLNEILLPTPFVHEGESIMNLHMAKDAILVSVTRGAEFIIPNGGTTLHAGDRVLCLTHEDTLRKLMLDWKLER